MRQQSFIPALRFDWLTRFYDPVVRVTTRERRFKAALIEQLRLEPGHRVLDLGCGTATLTIAIKQSCPSAEVYGLDGDASVLAIAREKAERAGVVIELRQGMAWEPPFPDGALDRVVSSLMFHHLDRDEKLATLRAARRVLAPGGELHVADWGKPHGPAMRAAFVAVQLLDGFATTADSVRGVLPDLMKEAGFGSAIETRRFRAPLGTISLYRAR